MLAAAIAQSLGLGIPHSTLRTLRCARSNDEQVLFIEDCRPAQMFEDKFATTAEDISAGHLRASH
jgi:hypothetical protein